MSLPWKTLLRSAAGLALTGGLAVAQKAEIPTQGLVLDRAGHRLHNVLGVPGAAVIGGAVETPEEFAPEAVSPGGDYVLGTAGASRLPAVWRPGAPPQVLRVPAAPDRVALSPRGTAAVLYYRDARQVVLISGLPGDPSVEIVALSSSVDGALAVSDDGAAALIAEAGAVLALDASGERRRFPLAGSSAAIAFAPGGHDAVIAGDSAAFLIRGVEAPRQQLRLPVDGLGRIAAAAFSRDGRRVFFAGPQSGKVAMVAIDAAAPAVSVLSCDCGPASLDPLGDGSGFYLTPYTGSVSWVLDTSANNPRVLAVPPAASAENQP